MPFDYEKTTSQVEAYVDAREAFMDGASSIEAAFFYFSPVNVIPKIWAGKLTIAKFDHGVGLVDAQGGVRVIPEGDQSRYYSAVVSALAFYKTALLLPAWLAKNLNGKHYKCSVQHHEYLMNTSAVIGHPGGRNAAVRGNINKASRLCTVEEFDPIKRDEYLALNKIWYQQNSDLKFRTYDKVSIDILLSHFDRVQRYAPDAVCLGVRNNETGVLESLNVGSALAGPYWTAYTQRYNRDGVKAANTLGYTALGRCFASYPMENDGTADTASIRAWKDRLGAPLLTAYSLERK